MALVPSYGNGILVGTWRRTGRHARWRSLCPFAALCRQPLPIVATSSAAENGIDQADESNDSDSDEQNDAIPGQVWRPP